MSIDLDDVLDSGLAREAGGDLATDQPDMIVTDRKSTSLGGPSGNRRNPGWRRNSRNPGGKRGQQRGGGRKVRNR